MRQLPTPVFLPGEFHGQGSLVDYSPWGHKELDMTEQVTHSKYFSKNSSIFWLHAQKNPFYHIFSTIQL